MYRLRLFGGVALVGPNGPVGGRAAQPRRLALIALIGAARNHGLSRDKVIALLWPDTDPVEARHYLSQSVYLLRKALGESAIEAHGESLALNAGVVSSDVAMFSEALRTDDLEGAVSLYAGPFLDGFYVREAPGFEEWVEAERRDLADAFATAVETAARARAGAGDHVEASDLWRRLVSHDPYNSRAVLGLMDSLVEGGDPGNALLVAEQHADRMQEDLGVGPAPEVEGRSESIRGDLPARPRRVVPSVEPAVAAAVPASALGDAGGQRRVPSWLVATGAVAGVVAVLWGGARLTRQPSTVAYRSVGVLPFVNMTGDSTLENLADGLTDELISTLSRVPELRVPAQTSSFHFKGHPLVAPAIGDSLRVSTLLEGSLREVGELLRVTAQLIEAETGFHLWTETYDRPRDELPGVPAEIARATVDLLGVDQARFAPRIAAVSPAWEDYEKGRRYWRLRTRVAHDTALAAFRRSIRADSTFALAWSGLVDAHLTALYYQDIPDNDSVRSAIRAMASRAVQLDSSLAETRTSHAATLKEIAGDYALADSEYRRALEIDPGYSTAYYWYWELLNATGRYEEALRLIERAYEVDPLSPTGVHHLGWSLMWGEARVAEALRYFEYVLDLEPGHRSAQINRAVALGFLGRATESRAAALQMLDANPGDLEVAAHTARIMYLVRDYDRLEAIVDSIDASNARYAYYYTASIYAEQGRFEDALAEYRAAAQRFSEDDELSLLMAYTYAQMGDVDRARAIADPIVARADSLWSADRNAQSRWLLRNAATVYGALGDGDTAFELFERVIAINKGTLANLAAHPVYDPLRDDPRFDGLLQRLDLPKIDTL